jgi:hypothetical protein
MLKNVEIKIKGSHRGRNVVGLFTRHGKRWACAVQLDQNTPQQFVVDDKPCMTTLENLVDVYVLKIKKPRERYGQRPTVSRLTD